MLFTVISVRRITAVSISIVLAVTAFACAAIGQDSNTLTNADIIKMVQAHLGTEVIVNQIQAQPGKYSLSTTSLITLKQDGVPDTVVQAMQAKERGSAAAAASRSSNGAGGVTAGREYTVAEFSSTLPEILSKAAVAHGLEAHAYDKDAAFIKQTLETCALDASNLSSARPDPNDPKFEICQRMTYKHLYVDTFKDVSIAAGNPHNSDSPRALGRGDLMMDVGEPVNRPWWPGEKYTIALKIFMDWGPDMHFRFDDVVSGALIKGRPPAVASSAAPPSPSAPNPASVSHPAAQSASASTPAYRTLDPVSFKALQPGEALDLNLFRLQPSLLEDAQALNYFIRLNNRGNGQIESQMSNEFDYPQIAAFYKARASEILKGLPPTTLTFSVHTSLGDYDLARKAFPFNQQVQLDHFDVVPGPGANAVRGLGASYEIAFKGVIFNELPMDEAAARNYVASLPAVANPSPVARLALRGVNLRVDVEILDQPLKTLPFRKVGLTGRLTKATAFKATDQTALADLSTDGSVAPSNSPTISAHPDKAGRAFQQDIASCNAGNAKACQTTGSSYLLGSGVDKDIDMARQYYQKACDMGNDVSCAAVKLLK